MAKQETVTLDCPKSMVGRVIGKSGETIKALQTYTGALIQIDQTVDPTKVTISGMKQNLELAASMVTDIMKGTFKGFALLRTLPGGPNAPMGPTGVMQQRPVYAPGYGLIPPSQLYGPVGKVGAPLHDPSSHAMPGVWLAGQGGAPMMGMHPLGADVVAPGLADETSMLMGYAPMGVPALYGYSADFCMPGMMPGGEMPYAAPGGMAYPAPSAMGHAMGGSSSNRMYQAAGRRNNGSSGMAALGAAPARYGAGLGSNRSHFMAAAAGSPPRGGLEGGGRRPEPGWVPAMGPDGSMGYANPEGVLQQHG